MHSKGNYDMKIKNMFKFIKYRGIPYPAFGYRSMFTSRNYEINYTKYLCCDYKFPFMIKTRILDHKHPFRQHVIDKINSNPDLEIFKWYFDDMVGISEGAYMWYVKNKHTDEVLGNIIDMYYLSDLEQLTHNTGFDPKTNRWHGWSHRARCSFGIGDKIFEEDFGDENTLFTEHGSKFIRTLNDAKYSAQKFAESVS